MRSGILLAAIVESISTRKDRTIKIVLGTNELPPAKAGELFTLNNQICSTYIKAEGITDTEMQLVDSNNSEFEGKTQSQRIRNVLFILWNQDNDGFNDYDSFYKNKTEQIINQLKSKIN
jgi:hypothetical protein